MKKLFIAAMVLTIVSCQNPVNRQMVTSPEETIYSVLSTLKSIKDNPWKSIQKSSKISIPHNNRIQTERQQLLLGKNAFEYATVQAEPYMYYIIDQLQMRNMPIELAIIPLMESAYNPKATSSAKAAGLWQMMPTTAKAYGMKSNHWYDSRRDLIASTDAALNYLEYLNHFFKGDWLLTLAAYNAGEGRIRRAQQWNQAHHLPTNFWALKLPKETMRYVPKLLAIVDIVQNNTKYHITLPKGDYTNALIQIHVGEPIDLKTIAKLTDLSLDELQLYNAAYIKNTLKGPYHLFIPGHQIKKLHDNLMKHHYTDIEIVNLLSLPEMDNPFPYANMKVTNRTYLTITDADLQFYAKEHLRHQKIIYQIKPGDNLSRIARNHKVAINQLLQWNKLKNANSLRAGDTLVINGQH